MALGMVSGPPTRFPNGINNSRDKTLFSELGVLNPTKYNVFHADFNRFQFAVGAGPADIDWIQHGTGSPSTAQANEDGGAYTFSNGNAISGEHVEVQLKNEIHLFSTSKKLWFRGRVKIDDAINSHMILGLSISTSNPYFVAPIDGVYFESNNGDGLVDLVMRKNATETRKDGFITIADNTYFDIGFYFDGTQFRIFSDSNVVTDGIQTDLTNLPDDEVLAPIIALANGAASTSEITADDFFSAKEI